MREGLREARLFGVEHPRLSEIASVAEGPVAIALSRGGAPKPYAHKHPNEDAVGFAVSPWGIVLVAADGHAGHEAARIALARVLDAHAPRWLRPTPIALETRFCSEAPDVVADVHAAILNGTTGTAAQGSRTTLCVALVRPDDGWCGFLSVGDSHVFRVLREGVQEAKAPERARVAYLGDARLSREGLAAAVHCDVSGMGNAIAVVLATDGLSEQGIGVEDPAAAVWDACAAAGAAAPALRPLASARGLAELALAAQRRHGAGDNVATAVLRLDCV